MTNERPNPSLEGEAHFPQRHGPSREASSSEVLYAALVSCYARLFALEDLLCEKLNLSQEEIDKLAQQKLPEARKFVSGFFDRFGS